MTTHNSRHGLLLEQRGEVTVVRLTMSEVMLVEVIESVGDELFALGGGICSSTSRTSARSPAPCWEN
jgi:hypothetical protein